MLLRVTATALALMAILAAPALAAPPENDGPERAGEFTTYFAPNGTPRDTAALADLAEATTDPGVPRCLGADSFERTAWYRVPPAERTRDVTVEATGRTTALVDLAAFVQPPAGTNTAEPNACSGEGGGASEISEEPSSAVAVRVPAGRSLLVQVGRRGAAGAAEDEQAAVSLAAIDVDETPRPEGDEANAAPAVGDAPFAIGGATLTEEDPAQPACPSLGSVWRLLPGGASDVVALGSDISTLTVFAGARPTGDNAVACVNRVGSEPLRVRADSTGPVWVRIGTDNPAATAFATIVAGLPASPAARGGEERRRATRACIPRAQRALPVLKLLLDNRVQRVRPRNRLRTFPVPVQVRRGPLCGARIALVGPRGRVYARGRARRVGGRRVLTLRRVRRVVRGSYRLRATALLPSGRRGRVLSSSRLRLR